MRTAWLLSVSLLVALGTAGCGSSNPASNTGTTPDFALSASPTAASLTAGATGQAISVTATASNGFASPVTVTPSGLPTGVTANPTSLTLNPGVGQKITLTAGSTVATGSAMVTLTGTSGKLSHTATVALTTTAAPPDFTLTVTPASQTLAAGTTGSALAVAATAVNGFASPVSVAITGMPAGVTANPASLTLTPGTAQNVTLAAAATATIGQATVTFTGTSGTLSHAATLALTVQAAPIPDVTTYHYDNTRDGLNAQETVLTPANVNSTSFGKLAFFSADGKVDAQPLYLAGLNVNGTATNVVYVASENDSVYAYNADTGAPIWEVSMLGSGETPSDDHSCGQISPQIGVTSTPVIDRAKGAIFLVAMSKDATGAYHQRLHALSLTTGADLPGSPTEITGSYPGKGGNSQNGTVTFLPGTYAERAGLLLLNGTIYLTWTSHCDLPDPNGRRYTGWVMGYSENTLQQTTILNLTPNGQDGSVWMAGDGLAADTQGNIYFLDANGKFDVTLDANGFPTQQDYGNAIMKLSTAGGRLAVADYFEMYDTVKESESDLDLGSGGALLLPDMTDATGKVRHLLVGAGKDTNIYVADRDNLGKFNSSNNNNLYQELPVALPAAAWSSPAYFNGTVYYAANNDTLKAFPFTQALMATTPSSQSAITFPYPGSTPSVSANGTSNGIVWVVESNTGQAAVLHAYDATNLSKELYNSSQAPGGRDSFGNGNKFITPVIVNGKVFVGTPTGVAEFGLLQ